MRSVIGGLLLLTFYLSVSSQEFSSVSGHVFDAKLQLPVENAIVELQGELFQSVTDKQGFYELKNVPPGKYFLLSRHVGYANQKKPIVVLPGNNTIDLSLEQKIAELQEVIIEGAGLDGRIISRLPYIETKFLRDQIESEATRDVTDFLRSSKNINGIRKGGTQLDPVVRGFRSGQLNVQLNQGQKIEGGCPNRMDPATAHVEMEDIESIEVLKGPYALRYGPQFGGLINLNTEIPRHLDSSHIHLKALMGYESNWNGNKEHLKLYGGYNWFFYNISGGRKKYGNYSDGNGNEVKSEFEKYNYAAQLGFIPFKNHTVRFNFEESNGRNILFPTLPMDERKDDTRLLSADYSAAGLSDAIKSIRLKVYQSDVYHEMDNKTRPLSDTVVAVTTVDARNQGLRLETGINLAGGSLVAGLDHEHITKDGERVKYMIAQPGMPVKREILWNQAVINNLGLFAEFSYPMDVLEFVGSVRMDRNSAGSQDIIIQHPMQGEIYHYGQDSIQSDFTNFSFSLGATWKAGKTLSFSLALGRGVRSPDMTERFIILLPIGYDKFDYLGNPRLKPETNNQVDLTLKFSSQRLGLMQVNAFYALVNDFITGKRLPPVEQKPLTTDVLGVKQFFNAGNARLRGLELSYATPANHKFGGELFASHTYGTLDEVLRYLFNENGDVIGDELLKNDALTEIPPLEATIDLHYRLFGNKFVPRFNLRMVAAQNHVSESEYEKASSGFVLAGLSFNFSFNSYVRLNAGVNNLFDVPYYEHLNRNIIGSSQNLYEPGRSVYFNLFFNF